MFGKQDSGRKPKRLIESRRKTFEKNRRRHQREQFFSGLWSLLIAVGIAVGAYYGYRYTQMSDFDKDRRFAVVNKDIVSGKTYTDYANRTALGAPKRVNYPPKYVFICLGEQTRMHHIIVVDEDFYRSTPLNTILNKSELTHFPRFDSQATFEAHYSESEIAPAVSEKDGLWESLLGLFGS